MAHRYQIVVEGNRAKFDQPTAPRVLVEASPTDRIRGIGLTRDDPAARLPTTWEGQNLLGFALMGRPRGAEGPQGLRSTD